MSGPETEARSGAVVAGVEPKIFIDVGQSIEVPGSGKQPWKIKRCDGYYTCTCGAFQTMPGPVKSRTCVHLKKALGEAFEAARRSDSRGVDAAARLRAPGKRRRKDDGDDYADQESARAGKNVATRRGQTSVRAGHNQTSGGYQRDGWSGLTTFNGRQLSKTFDPGKAVAIMLSQTWDEETMDPTGWWMSEKLDGVRAYWTGYRLISRTNIDWKAPQWFLDKLPQGLALDGELWRERDGFEELSGICQRADPVGWSTVNYFVFDAPDVPLPYEERMQAARIRCVDGQMTPDQALRGRFGGRIAALPVVLCGGKEHLNRFMEDILAQGGEGAMLRRRNSPYERKRSSHSRKVKRWYDGEGVVVGYSQGCGRYKGLIGSIGFLMASGHMATVSSGMAEAMRRGDGLPPKGSLIRYRCGGLSSDGYPRFPVFQGPVFDRPAVPKDPDVPTTALRQRRRQEDLAADHDRTLLLEKYADHEDAEA